MYRTSRFRYLFCYTALALITLAAHLSIFAYADDDAYIHFRIARHLRDHGVPYFNLDTPVMGSSSPFWTILLTLLFSLCGDSPLVVAVLNTVVTVAATMVYGELLAQVTESSRGRAHLTSMLALPPLLLVSSAGLMETPLAILTAGAGMLLLSRHQPGSMLYLSLTPFVRIEFTPLALLGGAYALRYIRPYRSLFAWSALGALPLLSYSFWYFGGIVPHTATAKAIVYSLTTEELARKLSVAYFGNGAPFIPIPIQVVIAILLTFAAFHTLLTFSRAGTLSPVARWIPFVFLVQGGATVTSYLVSRVLIFQWYHPLFVVPLTFGLFVARQKVNSRLVALMCSLLLAPPVVAGYGELLADLFKPSSSSAFPPGARARQYLAVGRELHSLFPTASLLAPEIGALGFEYRGTLFDACGLVTPEALVYHPLAIPDERRSGSQCAVPPRYVVDLKPDIIVSPGIFIEALLRSPVLHDYIVQRHPIFSKEDMERSGGRGVWGERILYVLLRKASRKGDAASPQ
jgi:hypothetical protein